VMFLGSCFADSIGNKLRQFKFKVDLNPFGILYNPKSIADSIDRLIKGIEVSPDELFFANGVWNSFRHHSRFSHPDRQTCLENINRRASESRAFLKAADFLFITFGTARVYEFKATGTTVANCHKIPADRFESRLLSSREILEIYEDLIPRLKEFNSSLKVVFTVSPIRHLKDGLPGNSLSKSILISTVHEIAQKFGLYYFPSFEIVMDDLRDYRFYAADMVHLSEVAVDYIWDKFIKTFIHENSLPLMDEIKKILAAMNHKPFFPDGPEFKKFCASQLEKLEKLCRQFPHLDFSAEKAHFE